MAVACAPSPRSRTGFQSQVSLLHNVFQPAPWLSQTNWPPLTQWLMFFGSAVYGAMNRGSGSQGIGSYRISITVAQVGVIVVYELVLPSDLPPFWVRAIVM